MSDQPALSDQLTTIFRPKLEEVATKVRADFMARFGKFVAEAETARLESLFKKAAEARIQAVLETDKAKAAQHKQAADSFVRSMETLGLAAKIRADAQAAKFLSSTASTVLDTLGDVALAILKTVVSGLAAGVIQGLVGGSAGDSVKSFLG